MKNIIIIIIIAGCTLNVSAAEQKAAAAQATQLSAADMAQIKEYRNAYELFKQSVLKIRIGEADAHLTALETQYEKLPLRIRNQLYALIPDDAITYRIGIKPIDKEFFKRANVLLTRIVLGTEAPFPPEFLQKPQCPTPPSFLVPKSIPTEAQKKEFENQLQEINKELRKPKNKEQETTLTLAIANEYTPLALYLIDTQPDLITKPDRYGKSPLQIALDRNNDKIARYIIEQVPATVNMQQQDPVKLKLFVYKDFPIHIAAFNGNLPMIKLLVENGADINARNREGSTPFFSAIFGSRPAVVEFFLKHPDMNLNIKSRDNFTPIQAIFWTADIADYPDFLVLKDILQQILESQQLQSDKKLKEELLNSPDPAGLKPLCKAAAIGWKEGAELFIKHGADCADDKYKDFLVPLIQKVEAERAKQTEAVLLGATPAEQLLPPVLGDIVGGYVGKPEKEKKEQAAEPVEPTPSTGPETEVD